MKLSSHGALPCLSYRLIWLSAKLNSYFIKEMAKAQIYTASKPVISSDGKVWWRSNKWTFERISIFEDIYKIELVSKGKIKWRLEIESFPVPREAVHKQKTVDSSSVESVKDHDMKWFNQLWRVTLVREYVITDGFFIDKFPIHQTDVVKASLFFGGNFITSRLIFRAGEERKLLGNVDSTKVFNCELDFCLDFGTPPKKKEFQAGKISKLHALSVDLKNLLESRLHADLLLKFGQQTIEVHKSILCARSEFLKEQFEESEMLNKREYEIPYYDLEETQFLQELVSFLYTGEILTETRIMILNLAETADRLGVKSLKQVMEKAHGYYYS